MGRWAFTFLMWYICVLCVQPQNRFTFLYPLRIADITVIMTVGLHVVSCGQAGRPILRMGPATILAILLLVFSFISLHSGAFQTEQSWNANIDLIYKNAFVLILVEAMAYNVQRIWAVQATLLIATLWWIKAGLRLSASGSTYVGDRIMGGAVSLIENPNGFAYLMAVMLPMYLFFAQHESKKWLSYFYMGLAAACVFIILQTGSRTGFVALIAVGLFLVPKYFMRNKVMFVVGAAAAWVIMSYVSPSNIQRFKTIPESAMDFLLGVERDGGREKAFEDMDMDEQSSFERRMKNKHTWTLITRYPVFGVGINPNENMIPDDLPYARGQVHNELLYAGRQMGFIGMGIYLGFIAALIGFGNKARKFCKGWWPHASDLGWTLVLQGVVFISGGFFSPISWNPLFLILTGSASVFWYNLQQGRYTVATPAHT